MRGVSAYSPPTPFSTLQSKSKPKPTSVLPRTSDLNLKGLRFRHQKHPRTLNLRCNSSSGDGDSGVVLDAFFLGKAFAEAVTERVESSVGEFFSTVGRLQAEQQKQVQEFQEDVLERARMAKEKAAREAMEAQGLVPEAGTSSNPDSDILDSLPGTTNGPSTSPDTTGDPTRSLFLD